jgi:hypothetical protein
MYLLVLGMINLSPRPFLTTGSRDASALGVAVAGFAVAGPMELFFPTRAAGFWGPWTWALLLGIYFLGLVLVVQMLRPRLVIYNVAPNQLRPMLEQAVSRLDPEARWAGDSLTMPGLAVQLHVEPLPMLRNVQLVAAGPHQNPYGWRRLEHELAGLLRTTRGAANPYGICLLVFGLAIAGIITHRLAGDASGVQQALNEMLRR